MDREQFLYKIHENNIFSLGHNEVEYIYDILIDTSIDQQTKIDFLKDEGFNNLLIERIIRIYKEYF